MVGGGKGVETGVGGILRVEIAEVMRVWMGKKQDGNWEGCRGGEAERGAAAPGGRRERRAEG